MDAEERKKHLLKALQKGIRYDGRKLLEFRPVAVECDITKSAEGSSRVKIGQTEVIVGVKLGLEAPYPDTPEQGNLMVNAELLPLSNPAFEVGPPGNQAIELARVVDRGIREAKALDTKKLCIKKAELVWSVIIDVCTVNDHGNLLDASALGAIAALKNARFPGRDEKTVKYDKRTDEKLPLIREPLAITVHKIGEFFLVDPLPEEEEASDAKLTVTVTQEGTLCALQKGGVEPLTVEEIDKMVEIAMKKAPELREKL